ncbi:MAG: hypothetical protein D6785_00770 [Planctomycetota bacterium]|nr:MAG: hypothetical protein D6785_00770 [Planctomycetota bacterium]
MKQLYFLAFGFVILPWSLWADTIYLKNGSALKRVEIIKETSKIVYYKFKAINTRQKLATEDIDRIEFEDLPQVYKTGLNALRKKDYSKAFRYLRQIMGGKFEAYAKYYLGKAYEEVGQFDEAVKTLSYFKSVDHRLTPLGLFELGSVYLKDRRYDQASQIFNELKSKNLNAFWNLKAEFGLANVLFEKKNYSKARQLYEKVARKCRSRSKAVYKELYNLARQGVGLSLVGEGNYSKAKKTFVKIIENKYSTSEALAGAYLGLGKVYFQQAQRGGGGRENYKKGVLCFLRVIMFFPSYKDKYKEALKLGAICFEKLGQSSRAAQLRSRIPQ